MPVTFSAALRDESGATALEYCLIASGISLVVIGSATLIGGHLAVWFQGLAAAL